MKVGIQNIEKGPLFHVIVKDKQRIVSKSYPMPLWEAEDHMVRLLDTGIERGWSIDK